MMDTYVSPFIIPIIQTRLNANIDENHHSEFLSVEETQIFLMYNCV